MTGINARPAAVLSAPLMLFGLIVGGSRAEEPLVLKHDGVVHAVAWEPDGTALASGCSDNKVRLWDPTTGKQTALL